MNNWPSGHKYMVNNCLGVKASAGAAAKEMARSMGTGVVALELDGVVVGEAIAGRRSPRTWPERHRSARAWCIFCRGRRS
jgi:hypothetical protein